MLSTTILGPSPWEQAGLALLFSVPSMFTSAPQSSGLPPLQKGQQLACVLLHRSESGVYTRACPSRKASLVASCHTANGILAFPMNLLYLPVRYTCAPSPQRAFLPECLRLGKRNLRLF